MTLCLLGTIEKEETGETELEGGLQKINMFVSTPFCLFTQEFEDLCSALIHALESPLHPLSQNERSQG